MLRALSRLAALAGFLVWLIPPLTAQAPDVPSSDRVIAIVRLKTPAAASVSATEVAPAFDAQAAGDPVRLDERRARRDRRLAARLASLTRSDRDGVGRAIATGGGRVIYSLEAVNTVVAEVSRADLATLRARSDVASVVIDEPRQAHIDVASQSLLVPAFWNAGYVGGAVDVAVIDTGLYAAHGAFLARSASVVNGVFHDSAKLMSNYWDVPTDPDDYAGHGTFVAGVIFSQGDTPNPARRGMAHGIDKFYNIKAGYLTYPSGGSSLLSDLMAGVDWALLSSDPPEVFNYSYGARVLTDDDLYTQFWDGVVDTFEKTATISSGNSGPGTVGSPGMAYNVLCVANINNLGTSTRTDDVISTSSSGGPTPGGRKKPDLAAPGTNLLMPSYFGPALWTRASGTSFSAPAAAGVAALLIDAGVADPRAVKAVLVNTADQVGSGWDPRLGWGYVNAERAFAHRDRVALTTLTAATGAAPLRLFERVAAEPTKATIAWNRHVSYQTGGMPSGGTLNNVDLRLYSRDSGELRTTSASAVDNVEQVIDSNVEGAVLAVAPGAPFSEATETIALAHSGGFVPRTGPGLAVGLSANANVPPASTFVVSATVSNTGDMRGHGYEVTLVLPPGFTLVQGALRQVVGSLDASGHAVVSWTVRAPATTLTTGSLSASASAAAYGLTWSGSTQRDVATASGCGYAVAPALVSLDAAGGERAVDVTAPSGCAWTVSVPAGWFTATPGSGSGNGTVTVSAGANSGAGRTGAITVAGTSVPVVQSGTSARTYYLAEGSTRSIFTLDVAIANPHEVETDIRVSFLRPGGAPVEQLHHLAARSRLTLHVDTIPGLESTDVSTVVESLAGLSLAVERTMTWDGTSYGGHGGTAVEALASSWYFAEGSQGFFDTYLLLANPGTATATATVSYLREGAAPVVRTYQVDPMSRTTVFAGADPDLVNRAFSIAVSSDVPIIAERAMYWSRPGVLWTGGHESAGVAEPATSWFLAEGATGDYFDEYVLVGNPNSAPVTVAVRYLLTDGTTIESLKTVPAQERLTIDVEAEDPRLANAAVSTTVTATQPVVVERAMYWPGNASQWQEAHNSFGLTGLGTRWALAEGRVGTAAGYETYILLANPSTTAATVKVTFLREHGVASETTVVVPPASRANVIVVSDPSASDAPGLRDETFGALVESLNGVGIAVERAMYWNSGGSTWAAGTNAVGTRIE